MYVCISHVCLVPSEIRREHPVAWSWSYVCMGGCEPPRGCWGSNLVLWRATSALNHRAASLALCVLFFVCLFWFCFVLLYWNYFIINIHKCSQRGKGVFSNGYMVQKIKIGCLSTFKLWFSTLAFFCLVADLKRTPLSRKWPHTLAIAEQVV